ncbi:MAG: bifunctional (p)ppGpp synthetase/guanosine-3',5'-bis(diphosphate) 3'-pyrophosphohydrolase [Eubacterium sp.]|nr:bifunctional (p)ppGpp synthetase/guanosine-3',5'-bis(diphosphate) 3'-pyrophosphohydrolase [Eubacterium sp.]
MIYTEMTKKAIRFAFQAHEGQLDRSGLPYILHPLHLAEQMTSEDACVTALLHDVLEDTDVTVEDLRKEGFSETQIEAVELLSRSEDEDYFDYVRRIRSNALAKEVKLADLAHNRDRTRLEYISEKDEKRFQKYTEAVRILTEE